MAITDPGHHAGGDVRIWKVHHCRRYDQDPRLWVPARGAIIYAQKFGIAAMRWLPVRNAKPESTVPLVVAGNVGGDLEQIRETMNTSRLHARIEHNPNFVDGARDCCSPLMTLRNNCRFSLFRSIHRSPSASVSLT